MTAFPTIASIVVVRRFYHSKLDINNSRGVAKVGLIPEEGVLLVLLERCHPSTRMGGGLKYSRCRRLTVGERVPFFTTPPHAHLRGERLQLHLSLSLSLSWIWHIGHSAFICQTVKIIRLAFLYLHIYVPSVVVL